MSMPVIKGEYKVIKTVWIEENYAALSAVKITDRDKAEYLLNVYEGNECRRYVEIYTGLRRCPEFKEMFLFNGALVTVFKPSAGIDIDNVFYKGAVMPRLERLEYAAQMMSAALSISAYPPEISCAVVFSRNIIVLKNEKRITVNFAVAPLTEAGEREFICLLADQMSKILIKDFISAASEEAFLEKLNSGVFTSIAPLYSIWLNAYKEIKEEYERFYETNIVSRVISLVMRRIGEKFRRKGGRK